MVERALKLKSVKEGLEKFKDCDVGIYPKRLNAYGTFDQKNNKSIFQLGYDTTNSILSQDSALKAKFSLNTNQN